MTDTDWDDLAIAAVYAQQLWERAARLRAGEV